MSPEHGNMGPQLMFGDFCVAEFGQKLFWLKTAISKMVFGFFHTPNFVEVVFGVSVSIKENTNRYYEP